jgi:hypothetical protein
MLEKLFKRSKQNHLDEQIPAIRFGRYSDNNKPLEKVARWNEADTLFKEKKYLESIRTFFTYLADEKEGNVVHQPNGDGGSFELYQGSQIIRGSYNAEKLQAQTVLARMPQPSVPVMRRLLEMYFKLYYSRFSLQENKICMQFSSDVQTANPSKLYYGLKEMATRADKQDDLLVQDFTTLLPEDKAHVAPVPEAEKEVKYKWFRQWILDTLELIEGVDADKFSGGIAYALLALAYRIDFLIRPEGKLLFDLEKIVETYFRKDDRRITEKNAEMMDCFTKMLARTKEEFFPYLFRSRYTFSIVSPQSYKTVGDAIYNANQNINWCKENRQQRIAALISEYGFAYCQYSYSLPKPITEFFLLFMMINYSGFFKDLHFSKTFIKEDGTYDQEAIVAEVSRIQEAWQEKYPEMKFNTERLRWDSAMAFNQSFTNEVESLNMETASK